MKSIIISILILLASTSFSYSLTKEDLAKCVVFIRESKTVNETFEGKKYEIWRKDISNDNLSPKLQSVGGTGFLISHNHKIYLVTAAHIAKQITKKAEIYWNAGLGKMNHFSFEFIQKEIPGSKWFLHPSVDIAIHPFGFTEKSEHALIPEDSYISKDTHLAIGTDVYIFGFPLQLGITDILSPLSKKAETASSYTSISNMELSPDLLFILLDQDLAQGYSGAPVFTSPDMQLIGNTITTSATKLIGIQSSTLSDTTGGKISLVIPIFYINNIFESEEFLNYEKTRKQ
jgi:hypothetical protein